MHYSIIDTAEAFITVINGSGEVGDRLCLLLTSIASPVTMTPVRLCIASVVDTGEACSANELICYQTYQIPNLPGNELTRYWETTRNLLNTGYYWVIIHTGWGAQSWTTFCGPPAVAIGGCERKY